MGTKSEFGRAAGRAALDAARLASGVLASAAARVGGLARLAGRRLRRIDTVNAIVTVMLLAAVATLLAAPWLFLKIVAVLAAVATLLAVIALLLV
jgi:hypothetical protein